MFCKRKTFNHIRKEVSEFRYLRMHAYVDTFRDMLYELRKGPASKITKSDLQKLFSDNSKYEDYVAMLRKKYQFMRAYNLLEQNEALFLVSGITKNFEDTDKNESRPYAYQTYIYIKNQKPTLMYEPAMPTYKKIKLIVENKVWYESIELPPVITRRLISYLSTYDEKKWDCNDFELHMLWTDSVSYHELIWPESRDWNLNTLVIGDCISLLKSKDDKSKHKAVYLWKGLFISKFGKLNIWISTLEQMHDIYKTRVMTLNRYFRDTKSYAQMKLDRAEMLKNHPDRERLEKVFANVGKWIC